MTKLAMPLPIPREWSAQAAENIQQNFERLYGSSGRIGQGGATFTNGLDGLSPQPGDLIVCTATGVFVLLTLVTTAQRSLTNNGGTPMWALVDLTDGVTGALPLANIVTFPTQTVAGRNTASTGVLEQVTLTQLLDWISGSVTKGDVLVRDTSSWIRVAAGALGTFLGGNGAGALPSYQTPTGGSSALAAKGHFDWLIAPAGSSISGFFGASTPTGTTLAAPAAGSILAAGYFFQMGTGATINTSATWTSIVSSSVGLLSFLWDFDLSFIVLTDASAITTIRYMIGMGVNNENADPVTANWIGFRYSTASSDGGWVGVVYDGTQAVTATVATIAANTRYVLRIRKVGSTVFFSVNGGTEISQATHVPVNNAYASVGMRVTTLANAVRSLWFSRGWCDYAS